MRQSLSDLDKPAKLGQWGKTNRPPPVLKYEVMPTDRFDKSPRKTAWLG
jgi:hypothetical protein